VFGETDQPDVWQRLGDVLGTEYSGQHIRLSMIDSGFRPDAVYAFCRTFPTAMPSKGHDGLPQPVRMSRVDVTFRGLVIKNGVKLWHVDSSYFKSQIHGRIDWPQDQPGAWHLPLDVSEDYARQLVAESKITLPSGKVIWKRHDRENHALDCEVYATAAARVLGVERMRPKAKLVPIPEVAAGLGGLNPATPPNPAIHQPSAPLRRRGIFKPWR